MKNEMRHIARLLAALMVLLTSCTADDEQPVTDEPEAAATPITLAATVEGAVTRSGSTGNIDYSVLASSDYGFGVFASQLGWTNQKVSYNGPTPAENPGSIFAYPGSWTYGDLKYWKKDVNGGSVDFSVDFYAYAPYVESPALESTGITNVSGTSVDYTIGTNPDNCVDLLWGVNGSTGTPWTGTTYEQTGGPVLFTFHHALTAIAVEVKSNIDEFEDYTLGVYNVTLNGEFYPSATLSLANSTPNAPAWSNHKALANNTLTITGAQIAGHKLLFVIPNAMKQDYTLNLSWSVTKTGESPINKLSTIDINDLDLLAGVKYYLILKITLKGIELDVEAEDWTGNEVPLNVKIEHGTSASESLSRPQKTTKKTK